MKRQVLTTDLPHVEQPPEAHSGWRDHVGDAQLSSHLVLHTTELPPPSSACDQLQRCGSKIALALWSCSVVDGAYESSTDEPLDGYSITYTLSDADVHIALGNRLILGGSKLPGRLLLIGPHASRCSVTSRESFSLFNIYIPNALIGECYGALHAGQAPPFSELFKAHLSDDKVLKDLTRALLNVDAEGGPLGPMFVDGVGVAIACHLIGRYSERAISIREMELGTLPEWRLRRVQDYIEENIDKPITLAELSHLVGLSRMHFAAQFRKRVGCSPHTYLLSRRIAVAQKLLGNPSLSTAAVAGLVGFKSAAHFAGAFRRIVGEPPAKWRTIISP